MVTSDHVWLVDASIYVFRAWFTWPERINSQGQNINAVLGFKAFVDNLLEQENPQSIAFAFDESLESSHRKEIYPQYKANRESAPENLRYQFKLCRRYVRALGLVEAASNIYEADDLIGTWALQNEKVVIVTADKDLAQLVRQHDVWWDYQKQLALDYKAVVKKFGLRPDQIADQLALAGDKIDNIPGVPGVGMTTAAKLLRRFETIDQLLASIGEIGKMKFRGAGRVQELIQKYQQEILTYRQLTSVFCKVPGLETDLSRKTRNDDASKGLWTELLIE